jgi:hypothetical protein
MLRQCLHRLLQWVDMDAKKKAASLPCSVRRAGFLAKPPGKELPNSEQASEEPWLIGDAPPASARS